MKGLTDTRIDSVVTGENSGRKIKRSLYVARNVNILYNLVTGEVISLVNIENIY